MTRLFRTLLTCLTLLTTPLAATAETDIASAESLVRASGLWSQLADFAPQIQRGIFEGLAAARLQPKEVDLERLSRSIEHAYGADRFRSIVIKLVARDLSEQHVPTLQDWYASQTGLAMTALEEAASADPRDPGLLIQEGNGLLPKFSNNRRELIDRLITVSKGVESAVAITIDSAVAVQRGVSCALPNVPTPSANELRQQLGSQRAGMVQGFTAMYRAVYAKTYANVAEQDLANYVDFLHSEAGRHYADVVLNALGEAFGEAAVTMARCVPASRGGVSV